MSSSQDCQVAVDCVWTMTMTDWFTKASS